jgi:hypothetical protein
MQGEKLGLYLYWQDRKLSAAGFIDLLTKYVALLQSWRPEFLHLSLLDAHSMEIDFNSLSHSPELFLPLLFNEDAWYIKPDGSRDTNLTLDSFSDSGFYCDLFTATKKSDDPLTISVNIGHHKVSAPDGRVYGNEIPNSVVIKFPAQPVPAFYEYNFVKELFEQSVSFWQPYAGWVTSNEFRSKLKQPGSVFSIGWMSYFNNAALDQLALDVYEKKNRLIVLDESLVSSKDEQQVAKAVAVRNVLQNAGIFQWPAKQQE